jgi:hypothetical protein
MPHAAILLSFLVASSIADGRIRRALLGCEEPDLVTDDSLEPAPGYVMAGR